MPVFFMIPAFVFYSNIVASHFVRHTISVVHCDRSGSTIVARSIHGTSVRRNISINVKKMPGYK
jgi:hypothetical protein